MKCGRSVTVEIMYVPCSAMQRSVAQQVNWRPGGQARNQARCFCDPESRLAVVRNDDGMLVRGR